jgi:hypothetical protein
MVKEKERSKPRKEKPKPQKESAAPSRAKKKRTRLDMVRSLIAETSAALKEKSPTVGDLIRLLEYERQLQDGQEVKEVKVTWVQSFETESSK